MNRKVLAGAVGGIGVAVWAVTYHLIMNQPHDKIMVGIYLFNAALVSFYVWAVAFSRNYNKLPVARGRVVAIVPAYNEEPELLRNAITALLNQTVLPDEIHVMDDGSTPTVEPMIEHERVYWHRQPNQGKRHAQANVLRTLDRRDWDYIFTVDSDSVPEPDALEYLLRAMSRPKVQAATGLILTRNWRQNFLTRVSDMNIGTSCLMIRTSRSALGAVETTSGALALYRAEVIFDNLPDYLVSGTNGDDRRLTMYASLRGDVVVVNEAMVHSAMPETVKGLFRQRLRWGKSAWQAFPFTVTNLAIHKILFPVLAVAQWVMLPIMMGWMALAVIGERLHADATLLAFCAYVLIRYTETGMYVLLRPGMHWFTKLWTWILLTPAELVVKLAIIYPAKYYAILKLRDRGWHTRSGSVTTQLAHAEKEPTRALPPADPAGLPTRVVAAAEHVTEQTRILPAVGQLPKHARV
ncbi:glycosyltransferase [Prauserella oleivorans]|uniref:Glycosyltransferase n=1 Tax=Prauserella oleivorans TaxID=1478153 RepID=A0ABW5W6N6_9PSEU